MNNREAATMGLIGALFLGMLLWRSTRLWMASLVRQLLWSRLTLALFAYIAILGAVIFAASRISLWTTDLFAATALWFLITGFAWFIDLGDTGKDSDFFKRRIIETMGLTAFLEFFINAQVLPLVWEIMGQVVLSVVALVNAFASTQSQFRPIAKVTGAVLAAASLGLLVFTAISLVSNWTSVDKVTLRNELLMPVWLAVAAIPYLYAIAFYMRYEDLFLRLSLVNNGTRPRLRAQLGMMLGLRGSLVDVAGFRGPEAREAAESRTMRESLDYVRAFKEWRAADEATRAQARHRLAMNADREGTDEFGLVLDRREFAQTKDALQWLADCHMGWYRGGNRTHEYQRDVLDVLVSTNSQQFAFESQTPVVQKVRKDGQAWYAYRVTPSGHIFGMGANGPPPSQWFYDGPTPPDGFPSCKGRGWTDFMSPDRPEWRAEPDT